MHRLSCVLLLACGGSDEPAPRPADEPDPLPDMQVAPTELRFIAAASTEPQTATVTVSNVGLGDLTLTELGLEGPPAFALDAPEVPAVLAPDEAVDLVVTYTPGETEERATLRIAGDDPQAPSLAIGVVGEGLDPSLGVGVPDVPSTVDLGVTRPRCPVSTEVVLANSGGGPLSVSTALALPATVEVSGGVGVLQPGASTAVTLTWTPDETGLLEGTLAIDTDQGTWDVALTGTAEDGAVGPCETLRFSNRVFVLDLVFVVDATVEGTPRRDALAAVVDDVVATAESLAPDLTVGLATYGDYGLGRPWTLHQQQTTDRPALGAVLGAVDPVAARMGVAFEALVQAGAGTGYDLACDGSFDPEDASPFRVDALFDGTVTTYDPKVPGSGADRGIGARPEVYTAVVLVTGADIRSPVGGDSSPGGCPLDADLQDVFDAWSYSNVRFVGVGDDALLPLIAVELQAFLDLDDDGRYDELAVIPGSDDPDTLRDALVDILVRSTGGPPNATLAFAVEGDAPVVLTPSIARGLLENEDVVVDVIAESGTLALEPGAGTWNPVVVVAREEGRVVDRQTLWHQP